MTEQPTSLRAAFTVTVESRQGPAYFDRDGFVRHAASCIEGALEGHDDIRDVTVEEQQAATTPPSADRSALRNRIAEAIRESDFREWPLRRSFTAADAVMPLLPGPTDPAAEEAYRLALSNALRLGTGANWEAIRDRAEDLVAEVEELTSARRRLLDQRHDTEHRAPGDRAAVLREVAEICDEAAAVHAERGADDPASGHNTAAGALFALMERFQRKADEAGYVAAPCDPVNPCEDGGEPCHVHERLMAHAEGNHELCEPDCGTRPAVEAGDSEQQDDGEAFTIQVWPLTRVLSEVRCGSKDWPWEEEWADLDRRHAETGYLDKLEQDIRTNGITMPVLVGTDGRLWDGHHRLRIAVRLGIDYVPVEVPERAEEQGEAPQSAPTDEDFTVAIDSILDRLVPVLGVVAHERTRDSLGAVLAPLVQQLRRDRDSAIAHDRQPYPTAWAYEQACKALRKHQERAERLASILVDVRAKHRARTERHGSGCLQCGIVWPCPTYKMLGEVEPAADPLAGEPRPDALVYDPEADASREQMSARVQGNTEARPPTTGWRTETPLRGEWRHTGATYDDHAWASERYRDAIEADPDREFRLVRATTTYTVEAEHDPNATDAQDSPPREPHPTQADVDHALAVLDRFQGQDTAAEAQQDGAQDHG